MSQFLIAGIFLLLAVPLMAQTAPDSEKVFELRTYTAAEGKLPDLLARFRDHTLRLFEKHGIKNIGYWVPTDPERSKDTLIYVVEHASIEAAQKSWEAFRADPEWVKVRTASEANGRVVLKVEGVYLKATDFSKLR